MCDRFQTRINASHSTDYTDFYFSSTQLQTVSDFFGGPIARTINDILSWQLFDVWILWALAHCDCVLSFAILVHRNGVSGLGWVGCRFYNQVTKLLVRVVLYRNLSPYLFQLRIDRHQLQ